MPFVQFEEILPFPTILRKGFNSSIHLAKLEANTSPIVAFVGDSTVSQANYIAPIESQFSKIKSALLAKYPTKTFTFKDFSIGGQILSSFTTVLTSQYTRTAPWYTNTAATWISYVSAANCTSVFFSFGLNDTGSQAAIQYATIFADLAAFSGPINEKNCASRPAHEGLHWRHGQQITIQTIEHRPGHRTGGTPVSFVDWYSLRYGGRDCLRQSRAWHVSSGQ